MVAVQAFAPVVIAVVTADTALTCLLCVLGMLSLVVLALFNGRQPRDVRVMRYRQAERLEDDGVALDVLAEINECLRRGDFHTAHQYILSHTNWFFLQRLYLPEGFSNAWLMLRHRVNRILTVQRWPHDWAQRDVARLCEECLRLVSTAAEALGGFPAAEELAEAEEDPQSVRTMSAPSERNLSSMRS
ncbi:MAG: hypothetical protein JXB04_01620 [Kiritimatiellae bacterium]|nr:hypothetical protein [Kiritimatiellia bacterium]